MADKKTAGEEAAQDQFFLRERQAVNNAYAALQGQRVIDSFSAFTLADAIDNQIERIEGKGSQQHPNLLTKVEKIKNDLTRAVSELKTVDPAKFLDANIEASVNTEEDQ